MKTLDRKLKLCTAHYFGSSSSKKNPAPVWGIPPFYRPYRRVLAWRSEHGPNPQRQHLNLVQARGFGGRSDNRTLSSNAQYERQFSLIQTWLWKLPGGSAQSTLYSVPLEQNLLASKELTPRPPRAGPWKVRKCEPSLRHRGNEGAERRGKQIQLKGPRSIVGCVHLRSCLTNHGGTSVEPFCRTRASG